MPRAAADSLTAEQLFRSNDCTGGDAASGRSKRLRAKVCIHAGCNAALAMAGFYQEIGSLAGAGLVDLSAGTILTIGGNDASTVFSGAISGSGGVTKIGKGEFSLTGTSSLFG